MILRNKFSNMAKTVKKKELKKLMLFYLPPLLEIRHKISCTVDESVSMERTKFELGTHRFSICGVNYLAIVQVKTLIFSFSKSFPLKED